MHGKIGTEKHFGMGNSLTVNPHFAEGIKFANDHSVDYNVVYKALERLSKTVEGDRIPLPLQHSRTMIKGRSTSCCGQLLARAAKL